MGDHQEMVDQQERSLLTPFLHTRFWPCIYTLEEDVVIRSEEQNLLGWYEWHWNHSGFGPEWY